MISSLVGTIQICVRLPTALDRSLAIAPALASASSSMPSSARFRQTALADRGAVFADAAGKHDHVGAAQFDQVGAEVMADAGGVHVERQLGPLVATAGGRSPGRERRR